MRCRLVVILLVLGCASSRQAAAESTLRVLSYNIHHGRGTDGVVDLERVARVISESAADIAMLQEVDDRTARTRGVDQTAELARLTGLHAVFGRQIDYQGGRYGQAILARTPLEEPRVHVLPGDPDRETRIAFTARTQVAGTPLVVMGTHLHHLDPAARLEQARSIAALDLGTGPTILGGDLNALPDSPPLDLLLANWRTATPEPMPTFPAANPTRQIDHILFRAAAAIEPLECRVLDEPVASDHRPILAVFRLH